MESVTVWRGVALFAMAGWMTTGIAWGLSGGTDSEDRIEVAEVEGRVRRPEARVPMGVAHTPQRDQPVDVVALREEVRSEVLEEVERERAERRRDRSERRLERVMDEVARFAEDHDLDAETQGELESVMGDLHERMEALRPPGSPEPGGPPPEVRDALDASFEQLETDALDVLVEPELAGEFVEAVRPRGPGGRRGR